MLKFSDIKYGCRRTHESMRPCTCSHPDALTPGVQEMTDIGFIFYGIGKPLDPFVADTLMHH